MVRKGDKLPPYREVRKQMEANPKGAAARRARGKDAPPVQRRGKQ